MMRMDRPRDEIDEIVGQITENSALSMAAVTMVMGPKARVTTFCLINVIMQALPVAAKNLV